ncbi:EAL domain-containing protein [Altererythrobacter arenosus]|uniref:EAL domain-containing protein n=1 Tax=Altererythrobacter arenosus TaxID=3032592 RepID=A0ABY8FRR3_9SPHN|nr:EAL domain-containing protein [Altererythrobacter sp. CAU 1644]WFL77452.1 EAL domain-containing protein [Altererythrobacter sp. CAU 1644]
MGAAERDLVALGIAIAAIILFIATGGQVVPDVVRSMLGHGPGPDKILANALLLNIALIIFGWRRYRELTNEIAERRKAEEVARQLAETDPLTGCLNRRSMTRATTALRSEAEARDQSIAFFMIDLDNFKQINDMNGHSTGDRVLTKIAQVLRDNLPSEASLARLGGDEFAIVLPFDRGQPQQVDDHVMRLFEMIGRALEREGVSVDVTMSIGISSDQDASIRNAAVDYAQTLMHRADIAMYQAKKQGKNRYVWFEPTMENELRFRNELETGVRRGISNGEFVPFYEQQIDIETGRLVGFEMLARWNSPQLGLVKPDIFIPIAEDVGVIAELSEQLMVRAFADAQEWDPTLTLSVNISPVQLRDPWFAQKLLKLLVENNFPTHRLEIEITESCLHQDVGMVRAMIASLKNQGVRISLDDFGTGYSSLAQLRSLPFDRIKIDRSFITELGDAKASDKIVDAIISLGNGLEMPITAEGIENEQILTTLKRMGQLKGQGYLYGRPETAAQVRNRLTKAGRMAGKPGADAEAKHSDIEPVTEETRRAAEG